MSSGNKKAPNNVMSMFTKGPTYSPAIFARPGPYDPTGMRTYFKGQANAATSIDPAVMRAAMIAKSTGGPMKKGGKRTRRAASRRRRSSRRKH